MANVIRLTQVPEVDQNSTTVDPQITKALLATGRYPKLQGITWAHIAYKFFKNAPTMNYKTIQEQVDAYRECEIRPTGGLTPASTPLFWQKFLGLRLVCKDKNYYPDIVIAEYHTRDFGASSGFKFTTNDEVNAFLCTLVTFVKERHPSAKYLYFSESTVLVA
jgi:hypothetical protein